MLKWFLGLLLALVPAAASAQPATANSQSVVVTADRMIDVLGRERDVGAIAVGRYGDLVAVAGDPLQNVRLLENVAVVIKGGAVASDRRAAR